MIYLLYFVLGMAFAAFIGWALDGLGVVQFWRVRYTDESGEMM
jgi:hypothetical protein